MHGCHLLKNRLNMFINIYFLYKNTLFSYLLHLQCTSSYSKDCVWLGGGKGTTKWPLSEGWERPKRWIWHQSAPQGCRTFQHTGKNRIAVVRLVTWKYLSEQPGTVVLTAWVLYFSKFFTIQAVTWGKGLLLVAHWGHLKCRGCETQNYTAKQRQPLTWCCLLLT